MIQEVFAIIANLNYVSGKHEKAEEQFKALIRKNVKNPNVYLNYSIMLLQRGDAATALPFLLKAQTLKPKIITDKNILITLGSCYWINGEIDKAIEVLESLRKKYQYVSSSGLVTLGYMYILKEEYDKALELTKLALEDGETASAYDNLGQIYFNQEKTDQASEAFLKALELKPDLPDSNYYLGLIYEKQNNTEKAKACFEAALGCKINALNTVSRSQIEEKLGEVLKLLK